GLSLSDIFTIKSIFDFDAAQNTRLTDNLKKQAGLDVYALLSKGEGKLGVIPFAEIYAALNKTAEDNKYDKDDYNLRVLHYATDTGLMAMYTVLGILDGLINR
ncbi:MAG: hypothetical protein LBN42_03410, partial [Oscillospiraceae bacterium]|nr:hypothetical protein [Oscillospiraceae bacterium]